MQRFQLRFNTNIALTPSRAMVLSFVFIIAIATLVLALPICSADGQSLDWVDAFFLATSSVCVTGLTPISVADDLSRWGQLLLVVFVQLGGLGLVLFSSSLLLMLGGRLGLRGRRMIQEFLPGISLEGVVRLTKYILVFVFASELLGAAALALAWVPDYGWTMGIFHSVFHSITALCGAGFSTFPDGLLGYCYNIWVNIVIMTLIVVGGLGFLATTDIINRYFNRNYPNRLSLHSHVVLLFSLILVLAGALGIGFFERYNPDVSGRGFGHGVVVCLFQSVTCRSGGFNTVDVDRLQDETQQLMILLMFIGGAPGSMAGGIKVTTFGLLVMATIAQLRGKRDIEIWGRRISWNRILQALALTMVAVLAVVTVNILLNYFEHESYSRLLFESVSALGTVGLSTGVTSGLSVPSKLVLCVAMFMGRVGPLTLFSSLVIEPDRTSIRLPEGDVTIG